MKKNILIIGLASIFGIASGLISCSPDYETEFKVETLVVPDKSQAPITFPLLGGEHEIESADQCTTRQMECPVQCRMVQGSTTRGQKSRICQCKQYIQTTPGRNHCSYGHQSYSITVSQFGKEPAILIGDKLQQEGYVEIIDAERETLTIPVATNLNLDNIHYTRHLQLDTSGRATCHI